MKVIFAGILSLLLLTFISCTNNSLLPDRGSAGEIQYLEGYVTVNGLAADIGLEVMDGDAVVTGPDSYVEIKFGNYRILKAEENSHLVLNAEEKIFKLNSGALAVVQSKARWFSRKKPWLVETPTMTAAVRGTVYYTKVESPNSVYFCLCNGKIHLEDSAGESFVEMEAAHHKAVRFIRTDAGMVYQEAPMIYHNDEVIEQVADLVNVAIDWSVIP
ncbi:MAG: FecR domain-containing protein [Spirochaetaceae bacterium]|nr:FecR domain-containing protein [Spirochaetaceae bacterium]